MEMTLREASPGDVPALAALMRSTFSDTFPHYPPRELAAHLAEFYSDARTRQGLAHPTRRTWVADRGGELMGYAVAGDADLPHPDVTPEAGQLHRLYVHRDAQGRGLGARLFETALAWLAQSGRSPVYIGVWEHNLKAQAFYARYGFAPVGEYPYPVGTTVDRELILRGLAPRPCSG